MPVSRSHLEQHLCWFAFGTSLFCIFNNAACFPSWSISATKPIPIPPPPHSPQNNIHSRFTMNQQRWHHVAIPSVRFALTTIAQSTVPVRVSLRTKTFCVLFIVSRSMQKSERMNNEHHQCHHFLSLYGYHDSCCCCFGQEHSVRRI
jgi:hypothetical protein